MSGLQEKFSPTKDRRNITRNRPFGVLIPWHQDFDVVFNCPQFSSGCHVRLCIHCSCYTSRTWHTTLRVVVTLLQCKRVIKSCKRGQKRAKKKKSITRKKKEIERENMKESASHGPACNNQQPTTNNQHLTVLEINQ